MGDAAAQPTVPTITDLCAWRVFFFSGWNVSQVTSEGAVSKRSQAVNGENGRGQSELAASAPVPAGADTQSRSVGATGGRWLARQAEVKADRSEVEGA